MEYTVQKLAKLAGVSPRTLRHYDNIGLLKAKRISSNGYRIYGGAEVDRLQQILFYRELGFGLDEIASLLDSPSFDGVTALKEHKGRLLAQRRRIDALLAAVEATINHKEGRAEMSDAKKFEAFKQQLIDENEEKYGEEIREKYGKDTVEASNARMMNMTEEQYAEMQQIQERMFEALAEALKSGDAAGEQAQLAASLHKQWLGFTWPSYSPQAHVGLVEMYMQDERFKKYYEDRLEGSAQMLHDAVIIAAENA